MRRWPFLAVVLLLAALLFACSSGGSGSSGNGASSDDDDNDDNDNDNDNDNDASPADDDSVDDDAADDDTTDPVVVGTVTGFDALDVEVTGTTVFAAAATDGIRVVDISDPSNPAVVGELGGIGMIYDVSTAGDTLCAAAWSDGLRIVDVSDPTNPALMHTVATSTNARGVWMNATHAYVGTWNGDYINPDPEHGVEVVDLTLPTPVVVGEAKTPGWAGAVLGDGDTLYVADGPGGVRVLDISVPSTPVEIGSATTNVRAYGVALASGELAVADNTGGVIWLDVTTPHSPIKLGEAPVSGAAYGAALTAEARETWVAADIGGVLVFDSNDPAHSVLDHTLATTRAWGVTLTDTHAIIADTAGGLLIVTR